MPRYIIKLNEQYLEWSTIVDAPVTRGMTLEDFKIYYLKSYGELALSELKKRLERVESKGTSSQIYESLDALIEGNRAGEDESELTKQEIIDKYCRLDP